MTTDLILRVNGRTTTTSMDGAGKGQPEHTGHIPTTIALLHGLLPATSTGCSPLRQANV